MHCLLIFWINIQGVSFIRHLSVLCQLEYTPCKQLTLNKLQNQKCIALFGIFLGLIYRVVQLFLRNVLCNFRHPEYN